MTLYHILIRLIPLLQMPFLVTDTGGHLLKGSSTVLKPSATSQFRVCQTVSKYSANISRNIWRGIVYKCPKLAKKRCMTPIT